MAVSFINQITTNKFLPVTNPVNITVNSNNNGKCNFRYVCDIYLDNVNVYRFKLFPDPSTGYGFFQLSDVLQDYLTENLTTTSTAGLSSATSNVNKSVAAIYCKFGEEYDSSLTCDGDINLYLNLLTSNTFYVFNGVLDYESWPSYTGTEYLFGSSQTKFLTNIPRGVAEATFADNFYLEYLTLGATNNTMNMSVVITNKNGSTASTFFTPVGSFTSKRVRVNCGPLAINSSLGGVFISQDTKYYDIKVMLGATQSTETFRINVTAPKTYRTRLGFVNLLGSIDYITFYHRNRETYELEKRSYKRFLTSNKGSGQWSYAVGDRQNTQYASKATSVHNVSTFVLEKTSLWLNELWLSNTVFVEDRPTMIPFRVYREDSTPTSRMLFWLENDHGFKVGDNFFCYPDTNPDFSDYNDKFTIQSVDGNIVDCGLTYNVYSLTEAACGWIVKDEAVRRIPIVVTDTTAELKQKTGRPIEYQLNYQNSVDKFTLRS